MIRLKELREERRWNMTEAAKYLKKSYTTYVNHEKEYREPNSDDLKAYAKAYGVSVDYLIGRTNERKPATESDGNEKTIKLNSAIMKLQEAVPELTEQEAEFLLPQVLGIISARKTQDSPK